MNLFSRLFDDNKKPQTVSGAIRQGAKAREQWMGDEFFYRDRNNIKSNVFGALLEGLVLGAGKSSTKLIESYLKTGDLPPEQEFPEVRQLGKDFPEVFTRNLVCHREGCPESGKKYHVYYPCHLFMIHLNTKHHVPHERIAEIIEALETNRPLDDYLCSEFITDFRFGKANKMQETKTPQNELHSIADWLTKSDFGRETEVDSDPVFYDTVSDSHRILKTIIDIGIKENQILFKKPVYFSITDSSYMQATAIALDDRDLVFLTEGFVNRIRKSICKLLCRSDTFRTIGSPDKEKNLPQSDDETLLPQCPERREFANGAIQRALEYVFIHELAHIFYGHHDYLEKLDNSLYSSPFLMAPPQNRDSIKEKKDATEILAVRHAMEIQADRYAGDVILGFSFKEIWGQQHNSWSASDKILKDLEKRAIQELGIALSVVFNIVESIDNEFHTHPHPKYRRLATTMSTQVVWMALCRDKSRNVHISPDEFLNILNDIQDKTDEAWRCTSLPSIESDSNLSVSEFRNLLDRAVQLFPNLVSRFDKYHVI